MSSRTYAAEVATDDVRDTLLWLDSARRGQDWNPGPHPDRSSLRVTRQLPVGLLWHTTLPAVLSWLDRPGAEEEALAAGTRASDVLHRRFAQRHGKA